MGCCLSCDASIVLRIRFLSLARWGFEVLRVLGNIILFLCTTVSPNSQWEPLLLSKRSQRVEWAVLGHLSSLYKPKSLATYELQWSTAYHNCPKHISIWKTSMIITLLIAQIFCILSGHIQSTLCISPSVSKHCNKLCLMEVSIHSTKVQLSLSLPMSPMWTNVWDKSP